ncbi:MAG: hypothetical protein MHPSP_002292 [Paramarteilia canceri]
MVNDGFGLQGNVISQISGESGCYDASLNDLFGSQSLSGDHKTLQSLNIERMNEYFKLSYMKNTAKNSGIISGYKTLAEILQSTLHDITEEESVILYSNSNQIKNKTYFLSFNKELFNIRSYNRENIDSSKSIVPTSNCSQIMQKLRDFSKNPFGQRCLQIAYDILKKELVDEKNFECRIFTIECQNSALRFALHSLVNLYGATSVTLLQNDLETGDKYFVQVTVTNIISEPPEEFFKLLE